MYLDRTKILSYNAVLNFIVLKRGYGKTWTFKDYVIREFLKTGKQTVWLRRYEPELKQCLAGFLRDIKPQKNYENAKFEIKKKELYINDKPAISFIALSRGQDYKSVSFENYKYLIFDEFLIEPGLKRYIPYEPATFAAFISTVFRDREARIFVIGNKVNTFNIYNSYFNLPPFDSNIFLKKRRILLYCQDQDGIIEKNYANSDIISILRDSDYLNTIMLNKHIKPLNLIDKKSFELSRTIACIRVKNEFLFLYRDLNKDRYILSDTGDKTVKFRYTINIEDTDQFYTILTKQHPLAHLIQQYVRDRHLFFTNEKARAIGYVLLTYLF